MLFCADYIYIDVEWVDWWWWRGVPGVICIYILKIKLKLSYHVRAHAQKNK
jgi:hypothetical protein